MSTGPFIRVLQELADERTLAQGRSVYRQGQVTHTRLRKDGSLEAVVEGLRPYRIHLGLSDEGLHGECSCPAWHRQGVCKHLVALAWLADEDERSHAMLRTFLEQGGRQARAATPAPSAPTDEAPGEEPVEEPETHAPGSWQSRLAHLERGVHRRLDEGGGDDPTGSALFELWIEPQACREQRGLVLALTRRPSLARGGFGEAKEANWSSLDSYQSMPQRVRLALGRVQHLSSGDGAAWGWRERSRVCVPPQEAAHALEAVADIVHVYCRGHDEQWGPALTWNSEPWCFHLVLDTSEEGGVPLARLDGVLRRGDEERKLQDACLLLARGIALFDRDAGPLDDADAFDWITAIGSEGAFEVRGDEVPPFLQRLLEASAGIPLEAGALAEAAAPPQGVLDLALTPEQAADGRVSFAYGDILVSAEQTSPHLVDAGEAVRLLRRNQAAEQALLSALVAEGATRSGAAWAARPYRLPLEDLGARCGRLIDAGWQVLVENKPLKTGGALAMRVSSGIDWFDIHGEMSFDEGALELPAILEAVQSGRGFVTLQDGSAALVPPEWTTRLQALGELVQTGAAEGAVRISRARAPLLDVLLADVGTVESDENFDKLRAHLQEFQHVQAEHEPASFQGGLRSYQREALGWFSFLRATGLGGCLADDMGLGKTVQVLACLLSRQDDPERRGPSLVVAPRSVLSNWTREAARFAPSLRTASYHGTSRGRVLEEIDDLDIVVTTYGTMRADIHKLSEVPFDYVVLDEAQAIKNASSQTARAARLLKGAHRLALSGTPLENHLDELGSLFAFLSPGLLGNKREFQALLGNRSVPSPERLAWLQAALRPVILRRTREQVLTELPEKEEQVLRCPLGAKQRAAYDGIRDHYRASLLSRATPGALSGNKMHVLEALLRLRQAACHPGMIDPSRVAESAAKLDQLLPMLEEISDAGHKALVFSQFTSFLSIVRTRIENAGIRYSYLDGKTRDRMEAIDRFQEDADTAVFLISLKAGGTGLNLTAAQYVFLLDPWWNPAVEAQAIGRAHRMGQTNPVSVYRLIGEDTVEDRVLELQARKRDLVQAVLGGVSDAPLRSMTREDLELLLG